MKHQPLLPLPAFNCALLVFQRISHSMGSCSSCLGSCLGWRNSQSDVDLPTRAAGSFMLTFSLARRTPRHRDSSMMTLIALNMARISRTSSVLSTSLIQSQLNAKGKHWMGFVMRCPSMPPSSPYFGLKIHCSYISCAQ